ncbi:glycerol kinase GlpK [Paenibacillus sp. FSL K6-2524]|uniref:glycerol kinase GlpK n=1 Tax=Paenibacillus sp. FSL K6-2524 TaxID=2954516 RepID=UPI0030FC3C08
MKMQEKYILSIDQSTSGTKTLLVDHHGNIISRAAKEHRQYYPKPGWVEHDPLEIYENVKLTARLVLNQAGVEPSMLAALTITNQRETALVWNKRTGLPIYNAVVWQCQRTADVCTGLKETGLESVVRAKTGLMLDPYFSATKFKWILDHTEDTDQMLRKGELLAGNMDSWLIWKLTDGQVHATDYSNASRTSLYNIHNLSWDEELADVFGVPLSLMPEVKSSDSLFGYTADHELFVERIPISGIIGDSQGALYGHLCAESGTAKATYGTGTSIMMNTGEQPINGGEGLVTTIAWGAGGTVTYALEAVIRTTGDSIKWIRDNLGLFATYEEMDNILKQVIDSEGVYLVPAFGGLGAPYWNPDARAAILGMNRGTGKAHIIRAAIESIAYQVNDAIDLLQSVSDNSLRELRVDGGATDNDILMQFQTDILGKCVRRSGVAELSAMGSIYMGGLAIGFWDSLTEIPVQSENSTFNPSMDSKKRAYYVNGWKQAVTSVIGT